MRRSLALSAVLVLSACSGATTDARSTPTASASASEPAAAGDARDSSESSASDGAGGSDGSDDAGDADTGDVGPEVSGSTPASQAPPAGGSGTTSGGSATTQAPDAGPSVAAGTYRYDVQGTNTFGAFDPQPFEAVLTTRVEPARPDGTQRSITTTEYTSGGSPRTFDEERTVRHTRDAVLLARLVTDGGGEPIEFVLDPPVVFSPSDPRDGESWSWRMTSTDGATTATTSVTVTGRETATVGGRTVQVVRAEATVEFTGEDFEGTQRLTSWYDPATRLLVRQDAVLEGRARVGSAWVPIRAEDSRTLRRLQPA